VAPQEFVAPSGTMPVRPGEELDISRISAILKERCPEFPGESVSGLSVPSRGFQFNVSCLFWSVSGGLAPPALWPPPGQGA
jgi:hypothetical protein